MEHPIRIGVLGAARITRGALLGPAHRIGGVEVAAIAARDVERARASASRHGIPRVHAGYDALLADESLDAVYIPLPAALHGRWTIAAIEAGKHVLCEKPFTANAPEAEHVAEVAARSDVIVMEAYHSRYHPLVGRLQGILADGVLGDIQSASAALCVPIPPGRNIRWNLDLGGGGLLDVGYYPVRMLRDLLGPTPSVVAARARDREGIDRVMLATLRFDGAISATVVSSIWSRRVFSARLEVRGSAGRLRVSMPYHPQLGSVVRIDGPGLRLRERPSRRSTYDYQLEAFRDAIRDDTRVATGPGEAVAQMRVIDELYLAAGLHPRSPLPAG